MAAALVAAVIPLTTPFRCRTRLKFSKNQRDSVLQHPSLIARSYCRWLPTRNLTRVSAVEHFGEPNRATGYLNVLAESIWHTTPEATKEFPWNKAKDLVLMRLLLLGKSIAKWSFILLFIIGFVSDTYLSVVRNMELVIPLGLFIGVILADILKESSIEFFQRSLKDDEKAIRQLVGVGTLFILAKVAAACLTTQGRMLLSHVGNGGLMQVLWLVKKLQEDEKAKHQDEPDEHSPSITRGED